LPSGVIERAAGSQTPTGCGSGANVVTFAANCALYHREDAAGVIRLNALGRMSGHERTQGDGVPCTSECEMSRFQVLFSGEVAEGATEATVRQNLMRRLGLDDRKVAQLFSGRTVVVRSDLTREAADELHAELAGLGAIARIKNSTPDEKAKFKIDRHRDQTMKDITAAHIECPRCGHLQLETEFCARCGIDIATAAKQKRKEDILIEKRIRDLKTGKPGASMGGAAPAVDEVDISERLEPIKRRTPRPTAHARAPQPRHTPSLRPSGGGRTPPSTQASNGTAKSPASGNPFGGGFWRNMLKFGRKDDRP
jgi:hypothetical protein